MSRNTRSDHQKREGERLGSPQPNQRPTTRESRHLSQLVIGPTPAGRTQILAMGRRRMEASPTNRQPPPTPRYTGKPLLHLVHDIGPHTSTSSAEVTNRHRPSPNSHHGRSRETKPLPDTWSEQGRLLYVAPSNSCSWDSSCISFLWQDLSFISLYIKKLRLADILLSTRLAVPMQE
jgi:hypothetical protein